ncbi:MAG: AraC family transcriptional regulator [Lachnospiraceae bacterium]|nr:AraC family transcriptional regulator [Lachnospiraceae bacterium]
MNKDRVNTLMFPVQPPFDAAYRRSSTATPVGPHCHDAAELYYTLTPLPDVLLDNKVLEVPAGTLIIIPPFYVHQLYHEAGTVYERYILSINSRWIDTVLCNNSEVCSALKPGSVPILVTPDGKQSKKLLHCFKELLSIEHRTMPEALALFFDCLALVERISAQSPAVSAAKYPISASQKRVNEIIDYIHGHIYEAPSVQDIAAHFYLHPDYMSRLFKAHAHVNISRYILLQRIATAQTLLSKGLTVSQVQEKLGFSSYAYFFKTFQRTTGISPSRYRERYVLPAQAEVSFSRSHRN